jgi:hypothetical protein
MIIPHFVGAGQDEESDGIIGDSREKTRAEARRMCTVLHEGDFV